MRVSRVMAMITAIVMLLSCCGSTFAEEAPFPAFSFSHVGVNGPDTQMQDELRDFFENVLQFHDTREIAPSHYVADDNVELYKTDGAGEHGHIGLYVTDLPAARAYLEGLGYTFDEDTVKYNDAGEIRLIYMKEEINGWAFHLTTSLPTLLEKSEDRLYVFDHVGINAPEDDAENTNLIRFFSEELQAGDPQDIGISTYVANWYLELYKGKGKGEHGHFGIYTPDIYKAIVLLEQQGYAMDYSTVKYDNGEIRLVYLQDEINGFAFHLTTTLRR